MKTIKPLIFLALVTLTTASGIFAAEQGQSWWQRLWNGIWDNLRNASQRYVNDSISFANYVRQNPVKTALWHTSAACAITAAGTVGYLACQDILIPKAREMLIDRLAFISKIANGVNNEIESIMGQRQLELLKLRLQEAFTTPRNLKRALNGQNQFLGMIRYIAAATPRSGALENYIWNNYRDDVVLAIARKIISNWNIRQISPAEAALFAQKVQKAEQNLQ